MSLNSKINPSFDNSESLQNGMKGSEVDLSYLTACKAIASEIVSLGIESAVTIKDINRIIKCQSSNHKLSQIPKNIDILKFLPNNNYYKKLLRRKPVKTSSGIAVITVMPMPFECPHGKCIYCPGGVEFNTPLSYLGTEPSTKVAQKVNYDPYAQVFSKIKQLVEMGHQVDKAELVIVGGTFLFYPTQYQIEFVKKCYDAFNSIDLVSSYDNDNYLNDDRKIESKTSNNLEESKKINETSKIRCVGLTIETKPDYCKKEHIDIMLELGSTRVEIGVQSLNNLVYKSVNRGHDLNDVYESFYTAKNSGYKIVAHMMPGLPNSSYVQDIDDFKKLFSDERLKPDMLKIYPTLVVKNTGLYKLYKEKKYSSYSTQDLVNLLVEVKKIIPSWVRIMRIQREIEPGDIIAGPKMGNIRQLVLNELRKQGTKCKCIRCREIGLLKYDDIFSIDELSLFRTDYQSSDGKEIFLSFELKDNSAIFGFLRLRLMQKPERNELIDSSSSSPNDTYSSAVIRELHIYGPLVEIGNKIYNGAKSGNKKNDYSKLSNAYQHRGLGQNLLSSAEKICKDEFNLKRISIISAIGTKEYYRKFGYTNNGPYVTKIL